MGDLELTTCRRLQELEDLTESLAKSQHQILSDVRKVLDVLPSMKKDCGTGSNASNGIPKRASFQHEPDHARGNCSNGSAPRSDYQHGKVAELKAIFRPGRLGLTCEA